MKKPSVSDYLIVSGVKLLSLILMALPEGLALWLAGCLGWFSFHIDRRHKAVVFANLKTAFAQTQDTRQLTVMTKAVFKNMLYNLFELLRFPLINERYISRHITIENRQLIDEALAQKKGLIILGMHFGSWEIANAVCATLGLPYKIIARQQEKHSKLDDLLNEYRQVKENTIITRGNQTREIIRSLKNNEIIGMVLDQGGRGGLPVGFFGKTASFHTGPVRLALKFDVPVFMSFIVRQPGWRHVISLHRIPMEKTENLEKDIPVNLGRIAGLAQSVIAKHPEQYLWFYKTWKYSNERRIVILSDGKTGHLRQSQAVAKILEKELCVRGYKTVISNVDVCFKNQGARVIANMVSFLRGSGPGAIGWLRYCLTRDSFHSVEHASPDIVVSCGAATAAVNVLTARQMRARSIAVLRPGVLSFKRFDAVIVPRHDRVIPVGNVVGTDGALNLIDDDSLAGQARLLGNRFTHLRVGSANRIGVLIGGETKQHALSKGYAQEIAAQLKNAAEKINAELLVSTSRRTPREADVILKEQLSSYARCALLVVANEQNFPEVVAGIMGLSRILVVTSDSISMISEAASSGKAVIVVDAEQKKNTAVNKRHQRFLATCTDKRYSIRTDVSRLAAAIEDSIVNNKTTQRLDNAGVVAQALRKLL